MTLLPWNWLKMRVSAKKCCGYEHPSDDMYGACPWGSWTKTGDILVETQVKNCSIGRDEVTF